MTERRDDHDQSDAEQEFARRWTTLVTRGGDPQETTARKIGMSKSKMSRCCRGTSLPSDDEFHNLCRHRGLSTDEELDLAALLSQAREARSKRRKRRTATRHSTIRDLYINYRWVGVVALGVALVAGLVVGVVKWLDRPEAGASVSPPTGPSTPQASSPGAAPRSWPATVQHTKVGTFVYSGPFDTGRDRAPVGSKFDGDAIWIVCRELNGRVVQDKSTRTQSSSWSKLADSTWIPTMYTELAMSAVPSPGEMPACTYSGGTPGPG